MLLTVFGNSQRPLEGDREMFPDANQFGLNLNIKHSCLCEVAAVTRQREKPGEKSEERGSETLCSPTRVVKDSVLVQFQILCAHRSVLGVSAVFFRSPITAEAQRNFQTALLPGIVLVEVLP